MFKALVVEYRIKWPSRTYFGISFSKDNWKMEKQHEAYPETENPDYGIGMAIPTHAGNP